MTEQVLPAPADSAVADRRMSERYRCSRQRYVRLVARPSLQSFQASVRDFSMRSLGILIDKPVEPGTVLAIQLRSAHAGLSCLLSGEVKHATPQADGHWLLGCSLTRRLNDNEALALM